MNTNTLRNALSLSVLLTLTATSFACGPSQADIPEGCEPDSTFTSVSITGLHTCAIRTDETLHCWDENGAMGNTPSGRFAHVSSEVNYSCGIRDTGALVCWSSTPGDELPDELTPPEGAFKDVDTSKSQACAIREEGQIECWGEDSLFRPLSGVTPPEGIFATISVTELRACAKATSGEVVCWSGDSEEEPTTYPAGTFRSVATSGNNSCAITAASNLECGLGASPTTTTTEGTFLDDFSMYDDAGASAVITRSMICALREDRTVACFSAGTALNLEPVDAPSGTFSSLSTHTESACGVRQDGTLACWGNYLPPNTACLVD